MNWPGVIFAIVLCASIATAAIMRARAAVLLTNEQGNQLAALNALRRVARLFYFMYIAAAMAVMIWLGVPLYSLHLVPLIAIAIGLAMWFHVTYFRQLRALELPSAYVDAVRKSRLVIYGGCAILLVMVMCDY